VSAGWESGDSHLEEATATDDGALVVFTIASWGTLRLSPLLTAVLPDEQAALHSVDDAIASNPAGGPMVIGRWITAACGRLHAGARHPGYAPEQDPASS
jgi:hypothetical protein